MMLLDNSQSLLNINKLCQAAQTEIVTTFPGFFPSYKPLTLVEEKLNELSTAIDDLAGMDITFNAKVDFELCSAFAKVKSVVENHWGFINPKPEDFDAMHDHIERAVRISLDNQLKALQKEVNEMLDPQAASSELCTIQ